MDQFFDGPHMFWEAGLCANCGSEMAATPGIKNFCSDGCRSWAKDVRYFRRTYRDGCVAFDPSVREALQTRMALLVAGGYKEGARRLSREQRAEVLARNDGLCVNCNTNPATEVDHIDGDSPDPSNLQGLCRDCHQAKTQSMYQPMDDRDKAVRDAFLALVHEPEPLMLAHDDEWDALWRERARLNLDWALARCVDDEWWELDETGLHHYVRET